MAWETALPFVNLLAAAGYFLVGRVVFKRRPQGTGHLAGTAFAVWWFLLAAITLMGLIDDVVHAAAWTVAAFYAYMQVLLLVIVVALACLFYYIVYLFTGRRNAWMPIAVAYVLYYLAITWYLAYADPVAVTSEGGGAALEYARDLEDHWSTRVLAALLIAPPLIAALAYLGLLFKVKARDQRFRIAAVALAFIIWFGATFVANQFADLSDNAAWQVTRAFLGPLAALLVYVAFEPPGWIRIRLGVQSFGARR